MKTYKWFFLIFVSGIILSCKGTSEEELIGDWQRRQPIPGARRCHAATFVIGDRGYVIGGFNGSKVLRREVAVFDHSVGDKGVWDDEERFLPDHIPARQQAVGFSVKGKGYMGTGWAFLGTDDETTLNDFWQLDPETYTWAEVAPLPAKARRAAIAFSLKIGETEYGFVGCGYTDEPDGEYLSDFWRFDPDGTTDGKIGRWTPLPFEDKYPGNKRAGSLVFVINNVAYLCVGENPANITEFWRFDPNAPTGKQWFELRKMANVNRDEDYDDDYGPLARAFGVAYVVGGPNSNFLLREPRGHIVGGRGSGQTNWEYDHNPEKDGGDLWVQRTRFYNNSTSQSREGMISFSFPSTGRAFVGLGRSGSSYYDDFWEFIPWIEDDVYKDFQ